MRIGGRQLATTAVLIVAATASLATEDSYGPPQALRGRAQSGEVLLDTSARLVFAVRISAAALRADVLELLVLQVCGEVSQTSTPFQVQVEPPFAEPVNVEGSAGEPAAVCLSVRTADVCSPDEECSFEVDVFVQSLEGSTVGVGALTVEQSWPADIPVPPEPNIEVIYWGPRG